MENPITSRLDELTRRDWIALCDLFDSLFESSIQKIGGDMVDMEIDSELIARGLEAAASDPATKFQIHRLNAQFPASEKYSRANLISMIAAFRVHICKLEKYIFIDPGLRIDMNLSEDILKEEGLL